MHNRKLKRRYRIILWLLIGMLAAFIGFIIYFSVIAIDHPPVVNNLTSLENKRKTDWMHTEGCREKIRVQ